MKKLYIFLTAALSVALVSCQKELLEVDQAAQENLRTITVSFDESSTKTDITSQGKTVWKEGDAIWITNGTACDTLTVAAAYAGQRYCEFTTSLPGKLYVAYPCSAAQGLTEDGKIILNVPSVQNGQFGSANISAAIVDGDMKAKMKNVTSVLKFRIPTDVTKQVKVVSINSVGNRAAGTFSVDLSTGTPVVSTADTVVYSTDVSVKVDGLQGNFYATVIPGSYGAGFTMTAIALDLKNAYQSKTTTADKDLGPNELFDLGRIGDDLKGLQGDGSKGNPWQVSSLPEMLALTYYVNDGNSMRDQYVKLTNDIATVTTPVGIYNGDKDVVNYPFQGDFDGNDKTVTVNMIGSEKPVGLFAYLADSAHVHNVKIAGKVVSEGGNVGSLVGYMSANAVASTVENCSSSANVSGSYNVGGLIGTTAGDANNVISKSSFSGTVTAGYTGAGIVAYGYIAQVLSCTNSGVITTNESNGGAYTATGYTVGSFQSNYNRGTGGVAGWLQAGNLKDCTNTGTVTAYNKAGGVVGSAYWTSIYACSNSGKVTSADAGILGGIVSWIMTTGNVYNCVNTGEILATGTAAWIGGICGYSTPQVGRSNAINFAKCENKGKVSAEKGSNIGGIIGYVLTLSNGGNRTNIYNCSNSGTVSSNEGNSVGGIAGYQYDGGSWTMSVINGCSNSGNITGVGNVGGILGWFKNYYTGGRTDFNNCENTGTILSTKEKDEDYVGGLVGYQSGNTKSGCGLRFYNCMNSGSVQYTVASHAKPYAGGIIGGSHRFGQLQNCYNGGKIGPKEGDPVEAAAQYLGAITGYAASEGFNCCYALEGTAVNMAGTASTKKGTNISFVSSDGILVDPVTISSVQYANVVDALNAFVGTSTAYYKWTTGPKLVQPSYTDPVDGGGYDIGNGGEI